LRYKSNYLIINFQRARRVRVLDFCRQNGLSAELYNEVSSTLKTEYRLQSQPSEENGILESLPTTVKRKILSVLSNGVTNTILFNHLSNPIQFQLVNNYYFILFFAFYILFELKTNINLYYSNSL
jgi:hypothetical protein